MKYYLTTLSSAVILHLFSGILSTTNIEHSFLSAAKSLDEKHFCLHQVWVIGYAYVVNLQEVRRHSVVKEIKRNTFLNSSIVCVHVSM